MNGPTHILISTKAIFDDINSDIFKDNCKKNYNKNYFSLTNLSTIILMNSKHLDKYHQRIFKHFNNKPVLMTLIENN